MLGFVFGKEKFQIDFAVSMAANPFQVDLFFYDT